LNGMAVAGLKPFANTMQLDESSTLRDYRYADQFSVVRVKRG
jgi:hypothetical protein